MTRVALLADEPDVLLAALRRLGGRPPLDLLEQVARAVRRSGDMQTLELLRKCTHDRALFRKTAASVVDAGLNQFTLLDLMTEVAEPGSHRKARTRDCRGRRGLPDAR